MIETKIIEILKLREKPIKRAELLNILNTDGYPDLTDREMRAIVSELPICSCEKGYYLPKNEQDIMNFKKYLEAKAISLFKRFNRVKEAYPEFFDGKQLELFK